MRLWRGAVVAGVRVKQAFTFMSPEWDEFHEHARQSIESLHGGFKDDGKEVVASSGRRRVRGFAAGQILVTIMLINFNLRTIAKFLRDEIASGTTPRQRPTRDSILDIAARGELKSPLRTSAAHAFQHRREPPTAADRRIHRAHNRARSAVNRPLRRETTAKPVSKSHSGQKRRNAPEIPPERFTFRRF